MQVVFETPRLILRRFTTEDAPLIFQLNSDPEVLKYLHEPLLKDEAHATEIIRNIILPQYEKKLGRWAIHKKEDLAFIGWCGLKHLVENDETDLGYRLMKTAWGKGFATEAAAHTLAYGFSQLQLPEITGRAHTGNIASITVLQKIGMQYIGDEVADECPVKIFRVYRSASAIL